MKLIVELNKSSSSAKYDIKEIAGKLDEELGIQAEVFDILTRTRNLHTDNYSSLLRMCNQ
jgi:hypothetical protein